VEVGRPRAALLVLALLVIALLARPHGAAANAIEDENAKPGTPQSTWDRPRSDHIEGYTSKISVEAGDQLGFQVSTDLTGSDAQYRIEIYRFGWYGGDGARRVACLPNPDCSGFYTGVDQGTPAPDPVTYEVDAGWTQSASITVPSDWVSGEYAAEFVLLNGTHADEAQLAPFVVRPPPGDKAAILFQVPVNTWLAYNQWGGYSTYTDPEAVKVSFNRPFARDEFLFWEYPLIRFLEREGYDVSYVADTDVDADPGVLLEHRLALVAGHAEYWTKGERDAYEAARDQGTNLAFTGANDAYWQVRYEDGGRTMVVYKLNEPDPGVEDPDVFGTTKFRRLDPSRPECELMGVQYITGNWFPDSGYADYTVTAQGAADPWLAGTGLQAGDKLAGLMGFEFDSLEPTCDTPPLTVLFDYTDPTLGMPNQQGDTLRTAAAVKYVAPSGARVFSAGSEQLPWALDGYRFRPESDAVPVDPRMQIFARNMLDDLSRPAAPSAISVSGASNGFQIVVTAHPDPRVTAVRIYRHRGPDPFAPDDHGSELICETADDQCSDDPPSGDYRYEAVTVDRWAASAPTLSGVVTKAAPPAVPDTTSPVIRSFSAHPRRFRVGPRATAVAAVLAGTTLRFKLSESARVKLKVKRMVRGGNARLCRRSGHARRRRARGEPPRCTTLKLAGALVRAGAAAGPNALRFSGRIGNRSLPPGRYRLKLKAIDGAGNVSAPRRLGLTIVGR
jgi:hypothetical protein